MNQREPIYIKEFPHVDTSEQRRYKDSEENEYQIKLGNLKFVIFRHPYTDREEDIYGGCLTDGNCYVVEIGVHDYSPIYRPWEQPNVIIFMAGFPTEAGAKEAYEELKYQLINFCDYLDCLYDICKRDICNWPLTDTFYTLNIKEGALNGFDK